MDLLAVENRAQPWCVDFPSSSVGFIYPVDCRYRIAQRRRSRRPFNPVRLSG